MQQDDLNTVFKSQILAVPPKPEQWGRGYQDELMKIRAEQEGKNYLLALVRNVELGKRDHILDTFEIPRESSWSCGPINGHSS